MIIPAILPALESDTIQVGILPYPAVQFGHQLIQTGRLMISIPVILPPGRKQIHTRQALAEDTGPVPGISSSKGTRW